MAMALCFERSEKDSSSSCRENYLYNEPVHVFGQDRFDLLYRNLHVYTCTVPMLDIAIAVLYMYT